MITDNSEKMIRDKCRVAFVGAGGMIREHIRSFMDVDEVELVGITNRTRGKAESLAAEFSIPLIAGSIDELYAKTNADLVVMAVYEPAIRETALQCFKYPWAVFMEKPIGLNLAEARDVAKSAGVAGLRVWVGLNRRALASTRAVLEDLASDSGPRFIHVQDQQSLETARAIGHQSSVVDNWMFANSIHLVDYISAFGRGAVAGIDIVEPYNSQKPGPVIAKLSFDSGDIALYEAIWNGPGPWACTVTTPRRRWELRPLERAVFQNAGERTLIPVEPDPQDTAFKPGFRVQAQNVIDAWRGLATHAPTIADAMVSTEMVARIYGKEF